MAAEFVEITFKHEIKPNIRGYRLKYDRALDELVVTTPKKFTEESLRSILKKHKLWIERQQSKVVKAKQEIANLKAEISDKDLAEYRTKANVELTKLFQKSLIHFPYAAKCTELTIGDFKSKWGSCDRFGRIKLNWKLIFSTKEIQEYVIIHEICHLAYPHHQKSFWNEVSRYCENWKDLRQTLRKEYTKYISL